MLRCLLTDDAEQARTWFAGLLSEEPSLLLWCVCRASVWRDTPPRGIQDLSDGLAREGRQVLQWEDDDRAALAPCEPSQLLSWAQLASQSVLVSRLAVRAGGDGSLAHLALLGSLHNAVAWLAGSGRATADGGAAQPRDVLPAWLAERLRDLAAEPPADPSAAAIAKAIAVVQAATGETVSSGAVGGAFDFSVAEVVQRVQARWRSGDVDWSQVLPVATRKLARLRSLEGHFDRTLEEEKLTALKAFAYGASHEINNPLANISTRAQTLLREETDPERRRKLAVINSQAFRAHELIADLMLFARPPALSLAPVDLVGLADQVVSELAAEAAAQRTTLVRLPQASPVIVSADRGHLATALKAMCVNSLEALRPGGRIEIAVRASAEEAEGSGGTKWAELVIADTGPGIPPEVRRHLFDPYFSGREAGRGIGLGLSKSWRIVSEHGGRIVVESQPERGATFRIWLPAP